MSCRSLLAVFALAASSCVAGGPTGSEMGAGSSSSPPSSSTVGIEDGPDGDLPMTGSMEDEAEAPAPIELLSQAGEHLGERIDELALFGYRGRPLAAAERTLVPNLSGRYPDLSIRKQSLVWGVDSGAVLVAADGDPQTIKEAAAWLGQSTTWILAADGWMAAFYPSGLVDVSEMRALMETTLWMMNPDEACLRSNQACPFGSVVGYPPPPPALLTNADAEDETAPFPFITVAGASEIATGGGAASWIRDGQAYSARGGEGELLAATPSGNANTAVGFGSTLFLIDPAASASGGPAIVVRPCCGQQDAAVWPVPDGWEIDGLAIVGHFGQQNYRLILTAVLADGTSHAIAVDLDEDLVAGAATAAEPDLQELRPIHPAGTRWSEPRRTARGLLMVVEERGDGWYLIDDALGDPVDVARSGEQILSHAASAGNRNVALVTTNGTDTRLWWGQDGELTELKSEATSVAWYGSWLR